MNESQPRQFTVLDLEEKVDDEGFIEFKSKLTKKLMRKRARVDGIVKTAKGNVSLQYATDEEQRRVETILQEEPISGAKLRSSKDKSMYFL